MITCKHMGVRVRACVRVRAMLVLLAYMSAVIIHPTSQLTEDGNVFTWGGGFEGQLGHGDQHSRADPTQIDPGWSEE